MEQSVLNAAQSFFFGRHQRAPSSKANAPWAVPGLRPRGSRFKAMSSSLVHSWASSLIDQRLGGPFLLRGDFEKAVGQISGVRRFRSHLRDKTGCRLPAAIRRIEHPRRMLGAFPDRRRLVGGRAPVLRQIVALDQTRLSLQVGKDAGRKQRARVGMFFALASVINSPERAFRSRSSRTTRARLAFQDRNWCRVRFRSLPIRG